MSQEKRTPAGKAERDEQHSRPDTHDRPGYLHMPQDSDPAGDGHMFTPGPDWPVPDAQQRPITPIPEPEPGDVVNEPDPAGFVNEDGKGTSRHAPEQ